VISLFDYSFLSIKNESLIKSFTGGLVLAAAPWNESAYSRCDGLGKGIYGVSHAAITFYAGLMSFRAIQANDHTIDKQWLTFWLLYSLFELATTCADFLLGWVLPFYNEVKAAFLIFIGIFGGAEQLYPLIEPYLLQTDAVARKYEERLRQAKAQSSGEIKTGST
jgi:hypothetical protein